ncbi:lanthionine synthetase LanC family protein [Nonomuraea thailandensis]
MGRARPRPGRGHGADRRLDARLAPRRRGGRVLAQLGPAGGCRGRLGGLPRSRTAWCYGVPGAARALQLAGMALDRPDWRRFAVDALRSTLTLPDEGHGVQDAGLCHGWAGLLHLTRLVARDADDAELTGAADRLAGQAVDLYDPQAAFGFRAATLHEQDWLDLPGFLEGSAGIALALHAYAADQPAASGWDAALLVR